MSFARFKYPAESGESPGPYSELEQYVIMAPAREKKIAKPQVCKGDVALLFIGICHDVQYIGLNAKYINSKIQQS